MASILEELQNINFPITALLPKRGVTELSEIHGKTIDSIRLMLKGKRGASNNVEAIFKDAMEMILEREPERKEQLKTLTKILKKVA